MIDRMINSSVFRDRCASKRSNSSRIVNSSAESRRDRRTNDRGDVAGADDGEDIVVLRRPHVANSPNSTISVALRAGLVTIDAVAFQITVSAGGRSICFDAARIASTSWRDPVSGLAGLLLILTDPPEQMLLAGTTRLERRQLRILGSRIEATAIEARLAAALDRRMEATRAATSRAASAPTG
jgi:hypothetical protein